MEIRKLEKHEIECRVQTIREDGCSLLLYKDARCDMRILDEVFGIDGWQRTHDVVGGNLFCTVQIWSEKTNTWISKQDVGVESMTEKQKGQASDSFKRACFNIGIGRELYTAPFIWISLKNETYKKGEKFYLKPGVKFFVKEIDYDSNGNICKLTIIDNKKVERYRYNENAAKDEKAKSDKIIAEKIELSKKILEKCDTLEKLRNAYASFEPKIKAELKQYSVELSKKLS